MRKLLILGAGGHGKVVAEIAEYFGYNEISFLDDAEQGSFVVGKISDMEKLKGSYMDAFVGIGNNQLRYDLLQKLKQCGYRIPALIHPSAYISRKAEIEAGVLIEPGVIVNTNSFIGKGSILSIGSIIDHDVFVGTCCHINAGVILQARSSIRNFAKIDAGKIVRANENEDRKTGNPDKADSNDSFAEEYKKGQDRRSVSFDDKKNN